MIRHALAAMLAAGIAAGSAPSALANSIIEISDHGPSLEAIAPPVQKVFGELSHAEIAEINFTVRAFMWALDQKQPELLLKTTDQRAQLTYPSPAAFLAAVTRAHAVIVGSSDVFIPLPSLVGGEPVQTVFFKDAKGVAWKGTYLLKKQLDDRYAIARCKIGRAHV